MVSYLVTTDQLTQLCLISMRQSFMRRLVFKVCLVRDLSTDAYLLILQLMILMLIQDLRSECFTKRPLIKLLIMILKSALNRERNYTDWLNNRTAFLSMTMTSSS